LLAQRPVVHAVPVVASAGLVANALHAVGASPVMAIFPPEIPFLHRLCRSVVLSLGTPDRARWKLLRVVAQSARARGLPVVLDPVGVGFSPHRWAWAHRWVAQGRGSLIRGNRAEIEALVTPGRLRATTAIDAPGGPGSLPLGDQAAWQSLVARHAVLATGATDSLWFGAQHHEGTRGHRWQARVTGMGCAVSALGAAFLAVNPDPFRAALHALWLGNAAADRAGPRVEGPGTFGPAWLDALAWLVEHPWDCWNPSLEET